MPYGDKKSYSFFKMKYQEKHSAFPFKSPIKDTIKAEKINIDKMYEDEGIKYTRGSEAEQKVIREQWGEEVGPPVRPEDRN